MRLDLGTSVGLSFPTLGALKKDANPDRHAVGQREDAETQARQGEGAGLGTMLSQV